MDSRIWSLNRVPRFIQKITAGITWKMSGFLRTKYKLFQGLIQILEDKKTR